jgi:hypothetical protein
MFCFVIRTVEERHASTAGMFAAASLITGIFTGILSIFLFTPSGLFDPVWCKNNKWIITIAIITNGKMK